MPPPEIFATVIGFLELLELRGPLTLTGVYDAEDLDLQRHSIDDF